MAEIPLLTATLCNPTGKKIPGTRQINVVSARLVVETMDTFPSMEAVFGADERASVALLYQRLDTTIKFRQRGMKGAVAWGLVEDPALDINDRGDTITLKLRNITDQMSRNSVGVNAKYQTTIGSMVAQIGGIGESVEWTTTYDSTLPTAVVQFYSEITPTGTNYWRPDGTLIRTDPTITSGAAPSLWSATVLDDGPNVLSSSEVQWASQSPANWLSFSASNIAKLSSAPTQYTDGAFANQQIGYVFDGTGNVVPSPGSFSWQAGDVLGEIFAGLAPGSPNSTAGITYGWWSISSPHPADPDPFALAYPIANGAQIVRGGNLQAFVYRPGDLFTVAIDWTTGTAQVLYQINGNTMLALGGPPAILPLLPCAFLIKPQTLLQNPTIASTNYQSGQVFSVTFTQQTPFEALTQIQQATGLHLRQRLDPVTGEGIQQLEMGTFGKQTGIRLTGGTQGNREKMLANPLLRLVTSIKWTQETSQVINTITSMGASTGDAQVNMERLYWIIHNPQYQNYGRFGNIPGTLFPEYDGANYPIKATLGRSGNFEYWVRDMAAYRSVGFEIRGKYSDPQFQYASSNVASQELTARALYVATLAKLKWESQPNDILEVECVATNLRPPRAGDRVVMDFRRIAADTQGNFAVMTPNSKANLKNPYVTMVERTYNNRGDMTDKYTLSFLPRLPMGQQSSSGATSLRNLEAIKIIPTNTTTYLSVFAEADVDANISADHSLTARLRIPDDVFRVTSAPLDVEFAFMRQQVKTAANAVGTWVPITLPPTAVVTVTTTHGSHTVTPLTGHAYTPGTGFTTSSDGFALNKSGASSPIKLEVQQFAREGHANQNIYAMFINGQWVLDAPGIGTQDVYASISLAATDTATSHTVPINDSVTASDTLSGTIDVGTFEAPLPSHTHDILTFLNDTFAPTLVTLEIDPGTGVWKSMNTLVFDQISGKSGPWTASFFIPDLSLYVNAPGKLVKVRCRSLDQANGGVGHLRISGQWRVEIGGVGSTVFSQ